MCATELKIGKEEEERWGMSIEFCLFQRILYLWSF